MGEHTSDEFGQRTQTTGNVSIGDPEVGQFGAPSMIIIQGLDDEANANKYIVRTHQPGIAFWKYVAVLVVVFVVAVVALTWFLLSGAATPPSSLVL